MEGVLMPIYAKCKCGIIHILEVFTLPITVMCCNTSFDDMEIIEEYDGILEDVLKSNEVWREERGFV